MLTIHAAALLLPGGGRAPVSGGAVAVRDAVVAAFGPYGELAAAHPGARVRRWPGVLTPGLVQRDAVRLLEEWYFADPREADALGTEPLTGAALDALGPEETWRAGSVRRGLQQMLRYGTTHLAGPFTDPAVGTVVNRSGLTVVPPSGDRGAPGLDPFVRGHDLPGSEHGPLTEGGRADLAVFDVPDVTTLCAAGARTCVATVLGGRLVYRRR
ncbi:imidazolonepropionase-like domain-containing protein [Streptomyces sp. NPDC097595]|uniref:imidazolonepropionase-like domain-containing protein n=1 Tax=Streptomyces sp. NPDC097595 TaxID=3366090 RepID=UPI00383080A3